MPKSDLVEKFFGILNEDLIYWDYHQQVVNGKDKIMLWSKKVN